MDGKMSTLNTEMEEMKKITNRIILAAFLAFCLGLLSGCAFFDLDGNGEINPITYLQNADITVAWTDDEGNTYNVDALKLGEEVLYNYIQAETGYRFEIVENGGIEITDPTGYKVMIARKAE